MENPHVADPTTVTIVSSELSARDTLLLLLGVTLFCGFCCLEFTAETRAGASALAALMAAVALATWFAIRPDRVELHPDRIVVGRGQRARTHLLDDVVGVRVVSVSRGLTEGGEEFHIDRVLVKMKRGALLRFNGDRAQIGSWCAQLYQELIPRTSLRMEAGETIVFADRQKRGLEVSARGIRPLSDVEAPIVEGRGYRDASRDPTAWIPWADVTSISEDFGNGNVTVACRGRMTAISLSPRTDNLRVLQGLLALWVERAWGDARRPTESPDDGHTE